MEGHVQRHASVVFSVAVFDFAVSILVGGARLTCRWRSSWMSLSVQYSFVDVVVVQYTSVQRTFVCGCRTGIAVAVQYNGSRTTRESRATHRPALACSTIPRRIPYVEHLSFGETFVVSLYKGASGKYRSVVLSRQRTFVCGYRTVIVGRYSTALDSVQHGSSCPSCQRLLLGRGIFSSCYYSWSL